MHVKSMESCIISNLIPKEGVREKGITPKYENIVICRGRERQGIQTQDKSLTEPSPESCLSTHNSGRRKLASSRRKLWLARRRSRSIDSADMLCDYSARKMSSKLFRLSKIVDDSAGENEDINEVEKEGNYDVPVLVSAIRGASLLPRQCKKTNITLSQTRKSKSLNDIDYENVRLENPSAAEALDTEETIYDDPWSSKDLLELFIRKQSYGSLPETVMDGGAVRLNDESSNKYDNLNTDKPKIAEELLEINTIEKVLRPAFEVDTKLPLLQQSWYHDEMSRSEAESMLERQPVGAFLVRINSLRRKDLTLSLRTMKGVAHLIAVRQADFRYILGQFSEPFESAAAMIQFYTENEMKINGAPHTYLTLPVHCTQFGSL